MFVKMIGGNVGSTALPILGGYAGSAPGTALVMTAYYILGGLFLGGNYQLSGPLHFRYGCSSTRDDLWVFNIVRRATSRRIKNPMIGLGYAANGPCTKDYFYKAAAISLAIVNSGYSGIQTVHQAKAIIDNGVTPLDARFLVDFSKSIAGMEDKRANELVLKLLDRYEKAIENPDSGKKYTECCNLDKRKPYKHYVNLYSEIIREFKDYGLGVDLNV